MQRLGTEMRDGAPQGRRGAIPRDDWEVQKALATAYSGSSPARSGGGGSSAYESDGAAVAPAPPLNGGAGGGGGHGPYAPSSDDDPDVRPDYNRAKQGCNYSCFSHFCLPEVAASR